MEAIREIKMVTGGRVTLDLPTRFRNAKVEIIVLPLQVNQEKINGKLEAFITSESVLKKDWNSPKEDKAWQSL